MTSVTQAWTGAGGTTAVTHYDYDVQDHLSEVTDAEGNLTTYTYSDRDLMTRQVSPVSGTTDYAFNEHGEQVEETDARAVTVSRTYDAVDRLELVDYPDDLLDTSYTYGATPAQFSAGRLLSITRGGATVAYAYDRFGRLLQDGALTSSYDANGNPLTLAYPNGVTATYTYDFADRQSTLTMRDGANPVQTLVSASSYKAQGPLASLTLGNGLTETHAFSARYLPASIDVPGRLSWSYMTDAAGNPTAITDTLNAANNRTYAYQSPQYFLTTGNGPWGTRVWTYDKIGNRLTETHGAATDTYSYLTNGSGGHTPEISQIVRNGGATVISYDYDDVGDVLANGTLPFSYGDDRRMSQFGAAPKRTTYTYDGRGFLSQALYSPGVRAYPDTTVPTYSSTGLLMHRYAHQSLQPFNRLNSIRDSDLYVFYFAGRPAATLDNVKQGSVIEGFTTTSTLSFLTVDHLGTPILMTNTAGAQVWQGGFEPFGADYSTSSTPLRFPGQWFDATFNGKKDLGIYYNVNRYYETGTARYDRPDPEWLESIGDYSGPSHPFAYAESQPLARTDPLGLLSFHLGDSCRKLPPDRLSRLQQAVAGAQENLGRVTTCKQLVASEKNITIRCGQNCAGGCARYKPGIVIAGPSICVSPLAFGGANAEGQGCGIGDTCLASTIFHEMVHSCGGVHPSRPGRTNPYACEQKLYPLCRQRFPMDTGECPCTIE